MGLARTILWWYGQRKHVRSVKEVSNIGKDQFCKLDKETGEFIAVPRGEMTWREELIHAYEIRRDNKRIHAIERMIVYACFCPHAYFLIRRLSKNGQKTGR